MKHTSHFLTNELNKTVGGGQNPAIHQVGGFLANFWVINKFAALFFDTQGVLDKESVCIKPPQENIFNNIAYTLLLELKGFGSHNR